MNRRNFGWLPIRIDFVGQHFAVTTLSTFDAAIHSVRTSDRVDKEWYWPPLYDAPPIRPVEVFSLPNTHAISVDVADVTEADELIEFIVALMGFFYGMLLTPDGWVHFNRVSIDSRRWQDFHLDPASRTRIIDRAVEHWLTQAAERAALFGVLWWHTFAIAYEHPFERFMAQYMVLDACWAIHQKRVGLKKLKTTPHAQRVDELSRAYRLVPPVVWSDKGTHDALATIRNDLFHQARWGGQAIGFGHPVGPNESIHLDLYWFNSRLILALLGEDSDYVHSKIVHQAYLLR